MDRLRPMGLALATTLLVAPASTPSASAGAEVVIEWNQILQSTLPGNLGPTAPRYYAMLHVAIFDAVNAIERQYTPYYAQLDGRAGGSAEAAAAQAAHDLLSALFPASAAVYDAALGERLGPDPSGYVQRGAATGALAAAAILAWRQNDGWAVTPPSYELPPFPGLWQRTPPAHSPAGLTQAPGVAPFALLTPTQFLPPPPPTPTSSRYAADFNETKSIGRSDSVVRSAEQTAVSRLWAGIATTGVGTATGMSGIWSNVVRDMVRERGLSLVDAARLFALVTVSIHDGIQTSATSKLVYGMWRPITAIRRADEDMNDATAQDAAWTSLLATPPYPTYAGNMATVGASAAQILELALGTNDVSITATWRQSGGLPDVSRTYAGFWQLATEQARSRIYGGIHFQFDSDAGQQIGASVGQYVFANFMRLL